MKCNILIFCIEFLANHQVDESLYGSLLVRYIVLKVLNLLIFADLFGKEWRLLFKHRFEFTINSWPAYRSITLRPNCYVDGAAATSSTIDLNENLNFAKMSIN